MFQLKSTFYNNRNNDSFNRQACYFNHGLNNQYNNSVLSKSLQRDTKQRQKCKELKLIHDNLHKINYSVVDVKPNISSSGPNFDKQFKKQDKSVTEGYNLRRELLVMNRQKGSNSSISMENPPKESTESLLKNEEFIREINKIGPNYISPKFIDIMLKDHKNKLFKNLKVPDTTFMKERDNRSDIFNLKGIMRNMDNPTNDNKSPKDMKEDHNKSANVNANVNEFFANPDLEKRKDVFDSDIFFIKNNKVNLVKSYDNVKRKAKMNRTFVTNTESESSWYPRVSRPTLINHPSIHFNILNPATKGFGKTKEEILAIDKELCPHKRKSISECVDIFSNFCPKKNEKFTETLNKNSHEFFQQSDVCNNYNNSFHKYYPMIQHPFSKK